MPWIALFSWPLIAIIFFRLWSVPAAATATLIGGYLLLPELHEIDLPLLPPLDKHTIPAITALLLVLRASTDPAEAKRMRPGLLPRNGMILTLLAVFVGGAIGTVLTNQNPLFFGPTLIPAMRLYDSFSIVLALIMTLTPFLIARKIIVTIDDLKTCIKVIVVMAAAYALLALWEVRMSPQLNLQFYGFPPQAWLQHIRGGGFRPLVFLNHGLWLGIFFASVVIIACGMFRQTSGTVRRNYLLATGWLFITIYMSKVLGAFAITLVLLPAAYFLSVRMQLLVAASVAVIVLSYPVLRNADVIPTQAVLQYAESIDPARAQSLEFRLVNEDILLARAKEKPLFGWGGYGRGMVFNENGENTTIADGLWVGLFSKGGWFNYLGEYGLMTWGILALFFRRSENIDPIIAAVALGLAANLIDLLPNAGVSPLTWIMAGILAGRLEQRGVVSDTVMDVTADVPLDRVGPRYARDFGHARSNTHTRAPRYSAKGYQGDRTT